MAMWKASLIAVAAMIAWSPSVVLAEDSADKDLTEYSCKDVMRFSGKDRDVAISVLHGFILGKSGGTKFNTDKMAAGTDKFIDYCLDHPGKSALESMEHATKK